MSKPSVGAPNIIMILSEQHRYQGLSFKSDIIVISGLDVGDRKELEQLYHGCDPPCMLDTQDGRCNTSCPFCTFFTKMCSTCEETDSEYVIGFRYFFWPSNYHTSRNNYL